MVTVPERSDRLGKGPAADLLLVLAGLLILYVPPFFRLATGHWQQDEGAHGPIILAVIVWLIWRERAALYAMPAHTAPATGFAALVPGLLIYVLGRSQDIALLEVGALAPILAGTVLVLRGWGALRALWFPILFIAFLIPLPGAFVDALTGPLKQSVSQIAEVMLHTLGYPIARSGVMLTVGQYQLLVADACAGLNSMFSLSALGLLYLYLVKRASVVHNAVILASILPVAFAANVVRVIALILITFHLGDEAGQGFLHGGAGIVLLLAALVLLMLLDGILAPLLKPRGGH